MKNVGFLKFALVALVATSQLTVSHVAFGMAQKPAVDCPICFEQTNHVLHADHAACSDCFGDYIANASREKGVRNHLTCTAKGCQYQVTEADVRRIAPKHVADFQAFQQAQVEKNKPAAVHAELEDRSNLEWKFNNTKPCPNCHRAIEKNSGCKWVNCTGCHREFCYECLHQSRPGHPHDIHQPCIPVTFRQAWSPEIARLNAPNQWIIFGGIAAVAAIWGISEFYKWFKNKKAKKAAARKQLAAKRGVPARQMKPAARVR